MKLKALQYQRYAGKPVQKGEVFEANAADIRILTAIGRAEAYVEPVKPVPAVFKPIPPEVKQRVESMQATGSINQAQADQVLEHHATHEADDKTKRTYKRRDMKAE